MDEMAAAYYHPPPVAAHYPYYPPPPPPLTGTPHPPYHHHLPAPVPPSRTHLSPQHYGTPADHPSRDEVRTLFIAGLPDDVKPREIYNLFREFPGYQSAQLRRSGQSSQAYAFTVFTDQQSALSAMRALNGLMFDLERESTLYIDLAKSNSRFKRSRTDDGVSYSYDKRVRGSVAYSRGFSDSAKQILVMKQSIKCCLYKLAFVCRCPGFLKLKMQNKNGVPVAFVDFQDTGSSTGARNHLQGTILYSSVGEGMRLEYAKSRMGLRKREKNT
ncbi:uncharacterized protein LOC135650083 isoform X4 [Musa acuminata AAA Group]|uniref:uncharacterized protein LOC135650083 isoform X4 n=1 Tax=Musa acuminata AAA Group TaxID=214697 RepID=UPI0031D5976D